jgi:hypothetical protein
LHFIPLPELTLGKPFSLVRLGDAENSILRYPRYCDEQRIRVVIRRIFGNDDALRYIAYIRGELIRAIRSADIVGIYGSDDPHPLHRVFAEDLEYAGLGEMTVCHPAIHLLLAESGKLDAFIRTASRVTLITGRDVADRFRQHFPGIDADQLPVPTEFNDRIAADEPFCREAHFPHAFRRIMGSIQPEGPHHLFLIGAGPPGKIYCHQAKRRGGVAVDIGSVFDYWAGVATREPKSLIRDGRYLAEARIIRAGAFLGSSSADWRERYRSCFDPIVIRRR